MVLHARVCSRVPRQKKQCAPASNGPGVSAFGGREHSNHRSLVQNYPTKWPLVVLASLRLCRKNSFPRRKRSAPIRNHPHATRNKHRAPPSQACLTAMDLSLTANPISIRVHPYESAAISPLARGFLSARQHQWQVARRTLDENSKVKSLSSGFCKSVKSPRFQEYFSPSFQ